MRLLTYTILVVLISIPAYSKGDFYLDQVQPILDQRCVVCHSCYNSPCQLKLSSYDGVARGATKIKVYDGARLSNIQPTRLSIDYQTAKDWHELSSFAPVVEGGKDSPMYRLIELHKGKVPDGEYFPEADDLNCSTSNDELSKFIKDNPNSGMPFGFPAISDYEFEVLEKWLVDGGHGPSESANKILEGSKYADDAVESWEKFFNQQDSKHKLVSRYIYEHLFIAEIYFESRPGEYYRLVRSRSAAPYEVKEIPTVRPTDDPGSEFFYRFRKITSTIVHKTHITYKLSKAKMDRYNELFFNNSNWGNFRATDLPSYVSVVDNANPFEIFKAIPPKARYQFLLDDILYVIRTFIRGPVCKGSVALNVIEDHFWIMFINPDSDPLVRDSNMFELQTKDIDFPYNYSEKASLPFRIFDHQKNRNQYVEQKADYYNDLNIHLRLNDLWDGGKSNKDQAVLSVYRHEDSGSVEAGFHGDYPESSMILDYVTTESIYYALVANFDVFGNVQHQVGTRLYMDLLRVEGEEMFLAFLPEKDRNDLREYWYRGALGRLFMEGRDLKEFPDSEIDYTTKNSRSEFYQKVIDRQQRLSKTFFVDNINLGLRPKNLHISYGFIRTEAQLDQELKKLSSLSEEKTKEQSIELNYHFPKALPEMSLIRFIKSDGKDLVYTMIKNRSHLNVAFMLFQELRYMENEDEIEFYKGHVGSYPNFFFVVKMEEADKFLREFQGLNGNDKSEQFHKFIDKYGIRRSNPNFWHVSDWFNDHLKRTMEVEGGVLDLNRYKNYFKKDSTLGVGD